MNTLKLTVSSIIVGFSLLPLSAVAGYAESVRPLSAWNSVTAGAHGAGHLDPPQQALNRTWRVTVVSPETPQVELQNPSQVPTVSPLERPVQNPPQ